MTMWRWINCLRTGYTCRKAQRKKWKFYTGDTTCACVRAEETTERTLQCSNSHIPALWMTLLCSMVLENNAQNYGKSWFYDMMTMMMIVHFIVYFRLLGMCTEWVHQITRKWKRFDVLFFLLNGALIRLYICLTCCPRMSISRYAL